MNAMNWLRGGEVIALGWTLLHFCRQGAIISMLYVTASRATRNASSNVRYAIGMLAVALMPLVVVVTFLEQKRLLVHMPGNGREVLASQFVGPHDTVIQAVPFATSTVERSELCSALLNMRGWAQTIAEESNAQSLVDLLRPYYATAMKVYASDLQFGEVRNSWPEILISA